MTEDREFGGMVRQATKGVESTDFWQRLSVNTTLDNADFPSKNSRKDEISGEDRLVDQRDARQDAILRADSGFNTHKPRIQTRLDKE